MQRVFDKQKELMAKFGEIERNNGYSYVPTGRLDIDQPQDQLKIKELVGRIYEELAEAQNANDGYGDEPAEVEMIDALHFITELTIHLGYDWFDIEGSLVEQGYIQFNFEMGVYFLYRQLGMFTNTLKNRPWKQSMKPTNKQEFAISLIMIWQIYFDIMGSCFDYTIDDIIEAYLAKHKVNLDRIEDGK